MKTVLTAALLWAIPLVASEDPKLRQEANELAQRSHAVSRAAKWPPHRYVVNFHYTDAEGVSTEGTFTNEFQAPNTQRVEVSFGEYHSLEVIAPGVLGGKRNAPLPPPGLREMRKLSPMYLISFDKEDIINEIRDTTVQSRAARCIHFTSNFGAKSADGEVCYDRALGTLLHFQFGGEVIDNSNWIQIAGAWLPTHVEESEDGRRLMTLDQSFTPLDSFPPDTFSLPPDVPAYGICYQWNRPTGESMPQPKAGPGENIDDIVVQGRIERDGSVSHLEIRSSKRPDLDAEALQVAAQWKFRPATCEGKPAPSRGDFTLHFKGR